MILSSCKSPICFPFPLSRLPTRRSSFLISAILCFLIPWRVIPLYHIANPQSDQHYSLFSCSCSQHWALGETDMTVPPGPPRTYELQCLQSWAHTSSVCLSLESVLSTPSSFLCHREKKGLLCGWTPLAVPRSQTFLTSTGPEIIASLPIAMCFFLATSLSDCKHAPTPGEKRRHWTSFFQSSLDL